MRTYDLKARAFTQSIFEALHKIEEKLNKITQASKENTNLMPLIIDAALEYATLGEIVDSMKVVFGEWQEAAVI